MIKPGKTVKDIKISNESTAHDIFNELGQSGGFESVNATEMHWE